MKEASYMNYPWVGKNPNGMIDMFLGLDHGYILYNPVQSQDGDDVQK